MTNEKIKEKWGLNFSQILSLLIVFASLFGVYNKLSNDSIELRTKLVEVENKVNTTEANYKEALTEVKSGIETNRQENNTAHEKIMDKLDIALGVSNTYYIKNKK
jgi:predicted PurR-regulated permease PerM